MGEFLLFFPRLWQFSRPHTIIGTSLSAIALYLVALAATQQEPGSHLRLLLCAWAACLGGNIYIVGLNQLYDIDIDRVNKPQLPLASGDLSRAQGWWIVGISGGFAIALSAIASPWLFATVGISLAIGTAYSLPPLRLKRLSLAAALCILTVRGIVVNVGLFGYFSQTFVGQVVFPPNLVVLTLFILIFSVAIALFKDVPDTEGDRIFQIQTFTLILGKGVIFQMTCWVVVLAYGMAILSGLWFLPAINPYFFVGYHGILLIFFLIRSMTLNLEDKVAIVAFYQFIWKLFFLEYLLFPLACLLPL